MTAVPEAFWWAKAGPPAEDMVVERLDLWHQAVLADSRFIGVTPFLWPTLDQDGDGKVDPGAIELPRIRERVHQMALSLLHPQLSQVFPVVTTASSVAASQLSGPFSATDRDPSTQWRANDSAPQWLEFDLGPGVALSRVKLLTAQQPAGRTTHVVKGATTKGVWFTLGTLSGDTGDNQLLTLAIPSTPVRWVRVTTTVSPSWVAWREVSFFR
jgi:hypothetical protein